MIDATTSVDWAIEFFENAVDKFPQLAEKVESAAIRCINHGL
jgi:hypothetical protein